MQCTNNMKQIALACHNFYDTRGQFPKWTGKGSDGVDAPGTSSYAGTTIQSGFSVQVGILPFIEQTALFQTEGYDYRFTGTVGPQGGVRTIASDYGIEPYGTTAYHSGNAGVFFVSTFLVGPALTTAGGSKTAQFTEIVALSSQVVPEFLCPAETAEPKFAEFSVSGTRIKAAGVGAATNYMACNGSGTGYNYDNCAKDCDGIFTANVARGFEHITDGSSNTLLISEAKIGNREMGLASEMSGMTMTYSVDNPVGKAPDPNRPWEKCALFETAPAQRTASRPYKGLVGIYFDDNTDYGTFVNDHVDLWFGSRGYNWVVGTGHATGFNTYLTPNPPYPDWGTKQGRGIFAARSYHTGGVNAASADASVAFYPDQIERQVWHRLGSMNDDGSDLPNEPEDPAAP
jgi:hypothetical protein